MPRFVVSGVSEIECGDALTAWQEAHRNPRGLPWEIASIAPVDRPQLTITFDTRAGARSARARVQRAALTAGAFLLALGFPSHLVATALLAGRW